MSQSPSLRTSRIFLIVSASALILAACGSAASPTPALPGETPTEAPGETPTAATPGLTVEVVQSATLGDYLVGEGAMTLYMKSDDGVDSSTCIDECLANWPALLVEPGGTVAGGAGVTGTFATFERPEGTTQVSYDGQPLYYFIGDTAPGETNGEGLAGVWSVAKP